MSQKAKTIDIQSTRKIFTPTEFTDIMRAADKSQTGIYTNVAIKGLYLRYLQNDIPFHVRTAIGTREPTVTMRDFFATLFLQDVGADDSQNAESPPSPREALMAKLKNRQKILIYLYRNEVATIAEIARHLSVTATRSSILLSEMLACDQLCRKESRTARGRTWSYFLNPDYPHGDLEAQAMTDELQPLQAE